MKKKHPVSGRTLKLSLKFKSNVCLCCLWLIKCLLVANIWCQAKDEFAFNISAQRPFQLMPGISLVVLILENHLILTIKKSFQYMSIQTSNLSLTVCPLYQLWSVSWINHLNPKTEGYPLIDVSSFSAKRDKANGNSVQLENIKVSKVNFEKKRNLKLSWSSWEIHLRYLLFQLLLPFSRLQHCPVQQDHHHPHQHGLHPHCHPVQLHYGPYHHPHPHLLSSVVSQQSEPESEINHSGSLFAAVEGEHDWVLECNLFIFSSLAQFITKRAF